MAEAEGWRRDADERLREVEDRARVAEEERLDAERRCFQAERRRLDAERRAQALERLLGEVSLASARMRKLAADLSGLLVRLRTVLEQPAPSSGEPVSSAHATETDHRAEMADALAAAVERLRARAAIVEEPEQPTAQAPAPVERAPAHKHSMSWLARWRMKRRLRRQG